MARRDAARPQGAARVALWALWGVVVGLVVVPIVAMAWGVGQDVAGAVSGLLGAEAVRAFGLTLILTLIALVLGGISGLIGALVLVRQRFWGREALDALVDLPPRPSTRRLAGDEVSGDAAC